ncbi:MAG: hypothetical protein FJX45_18525 [Alphaproteobacteria bacterium]|nr:hypothetical protein [Alphaproteobacteria bacterium]
MNRAAAAALAVGVLVATAAGVQVIAGGSAAGPGGASERGLDPNPSPPGGPYHDPMPKTRDDAAPKADPTLRPTAPKGDPGVSH